MLNTIFRFLISRHLLAIVLFFAVFSLGGLVSSAPARTKPTPCFVWIVSPSGDLIAGWDEKTIVNVYEVNSMQEIASFDHPVAAKIRPRLFSRNSQYLVTTLETISPEGRPSFPIYVWDIKAPQNKPIIIPGDGGYQTFAFSPDSTRLVVVDDYRTYHGEKARHGLSLWNIKTGERLNEFDATHRDQINFVDWSSDGSRISTASKDGTVRLWDAKTGREIKSLRSEVIDAYYMVAAFTSHGSTVIGLTRNGNFISWDAETGLVKMSHKLDGYTKFYRHSSGYDILSFLYAQPWAESFLKNNEKWLPRWTQRWLYKRKFCEDLYRFQAETGSLTKIMTLPAAYGALMVVPDSQEIMVFDVDDHQLTWFKLNQIPVWLWSFIWATGISLGYWLLLSFIARRKRIKHEHQSQPGEVDLEPLTPNPSPQEREGSNTPTP